ncbi:MAG: hypothetical protein CFE21_03150 [Bacteroidetes bacterium B1(2017)]|nr:MAG: hypothetical protein CFE21_03150 [Bacteroidetes bacterium B1(2017)]
MLNQHQARSNWTIILGSVCLLFLNFTGQTNFLSEQKKFERVRISFTEKEALVQTALKNKHLTSTNFNLLLIAYKAEGILELYVKAKNKSAYSLLTHYSICASSGHLGPKRRYGDAQVPEGFYQINRFNPSSNYYLSLGLNYPNQADKLKSSASNLGGDIFIHGSCVTIGCMPLTDDKIKEVYLYAILAKNNGQEKIPVYVFPYRMNNENQKEYASTYRNYPELVSFWKNLKTGYDRFKTNSQELNVSVNREGEYTFN